MQPVPGKAVSEESIISLSSFLNKARGGLRSDGPCMLRMCQGCKAIGRADKDFNGASHACAVCRGKPGEGSDILKAQE